MTDGWNGQLNGWNNTNKNIYDTNNHSIDLIIVLAGGINNKGLVHEWVKRRLDRAIELHKIHHAPILCCGGGTYHKPPFLNKDRFVVHESTECVNYIMQHGINPNNIFKEWSSYDTIANGFFSLTNHVWLRDWTNIAIITSNFHLARSKEIFNWIYNLECNHYKLYNLYYYSVTDEGLDEDMIKKRTERENNSRKNIIKLRNKIKTMSEFHNWLYTEHNAYNNKPMIKTDIPKDCQKSY